MFRRLIRHASIWWSLLNDKRTPLLTKTLPWAALLYLIMPIDIVPDFLPLLGQLDDIGIIIALVSFALNMVPKDLWNEHGKKIDRANVIDI